MTENPKGGITENFGRIHRGEHSNLRAKGRHGGGNRESHQMFLEGITSVKLNSKTGSAKFPPPPLHPRR